MHCLANTLVHLSRAHVCGSVHANFQERKVRHLPSSKRPVLFKLRTYHSTGSHEFLSADGSLKMCQASTNYIKMHADSANTVAQRWKAARQATHLEVQTPRVQQVNIGVLASDISTSEKDSDTLTKHVPRAILDTLCGDLHIEILDEEKLKF